MDNAEFVKYVKEGPLSKGLFHFFKGDEQFPFVVKPGNCVDEEDLKKTFAIEVYHEHYNIHSGVITKETLWFKKSYPKGWHQTKRSASTQSLSLAERQELSYLPGYNALYPE